MPADRKLGVANNRQADWIDQIELQVLEKPDEAEAAWRSLENQTDVSLYQRFDWAAIWAKTLGQTDGSHPRIVLGRHEKQPLFLFPLMVRQIGPIRIAEWMADSHFNFQTGLYSQYFSDNCSENVMQRIMGDVARVLGGVDLMSLRCQPFELFDADNPMRLLPHHRSSNPAFALDLSGGFDEALNRINGNKRRKKHRWQLNQLGDERRVALKVAVDERDVERVLSTAFSQMDIRFRKLGIKNVFDDKATQRFFRTLASKPNENGSPLLLLYALEIDGVIRATLAGGQAGRNFSACFISLSEDDMAHLSPGQMLIYRVIEDCASRGITHFDFGRGDERYKRSWSDRQIDMIDVSLPLTAMGRSFSALQRTSSEAKRLVRNNERLWGMAKQMRATLRKAS